MPTLQELLDLLANTSDLSDAQLEEINGQLTVIYNERKAEGITSEVVDQLEVIANAIDGIRAETATREADAAELARRVEELDNRVVVAEDDTDEDGETEDGEADDEGEDEDADASADDAGTEVDGTVDAAPVAIAASATKGTQPPAKRAALSDIKRRQPKASKPKTRDEGVHVRVFAAADVPGVPANSELTDKRSIAEALVRRHEAFQGSRQGIVEKISVATARAEFPENRKVSSRNSAFANSEIFNTVVSPDAIVAAGGICAPTTPRYELAMISTATRPVRNSLPTFNADRGGINWQTPPRLSDIGTAAGAAGTQAIDQITEAEDEANAQKPYQRVVCGANNELQIYAVTNILEFGNLLERTYPEQVETWTDLSFAAHARYAENLLLTAMGAASTAVLTGSDVGSARDLLNYYNLAAVAYRSRHRMEKTATIRLYLPHWVVALYQNDLTNAAYPMHGDSGDIDEAKILAWYRRRNIEITFFDDGVALSGANQIFQVQAAGLLNGFPNRVRAYMHHEGAFVLLDGGVLDLGVVRDSTLNTSNVFRTFVETFEALAFVGIESLQITSDICASGISAGTTVTTLCDNGS